MILLQSPDGKEHVLTDSLAGYGDWTVVNDKMRKPEYGEELAPDGKSWHKNTAKMKNDELLSKVRNPEQLAGLLADILARLPTLPE